MLKFIKSFFKKSEPVVAEPVPYKVEVATVAEPTPASVQATEAMVESIVPAEKPAKKKPAAKKAPAAKKPRAPKKSKPV
jgi:hypothetical protein